MELIQKRWLVLVAFGARQAQWKAALMQVLALYSITRIKDISCSFFILKTRIEKKIRATREAAAKTIQHAYRKHLTSVRVHKLYRQIIITHRVLRKFIYRFRARRRDRAADTIRRFIDGMQLNIFAFILIYC